ncbi:hypothetical protein ZHAS_00008637 [Anopheles sinensis]|uniref:Uncharacterized protein n=1 Tax=Anopheles sinensis TaxID=74873 RepID=A0A084VSS7_ANOSI|nr:hypothetical protein ZHAS_00008637 [Anopheles sinensis]
MFYGIIRIVDRGQADTSQGVQQQGYSKGAENGQLRQPGTAGTSTGARLAESDWCELLPNGVRERKRRAVCRKVPAGETLAG